MRLLPGSFPAEGAVAGGEVSMAVGAEEDEPAALPRRRRVKVCLRDPALSLNTARSILRGGRGSASGELPGATACAEATARASRSDCESTRRSTTGTISVAIDTITNPHGGVAPGAGRNAAGGGGDPRSERRRGDGRGFEKWEIGRAHV